MWDHKMKDEKCLNRRLIETFIVSNLLDEQGKDPQMIYWKKKKMCLVILKEGNCSYVMQDK